MATPPSSDLPDGGFRRFDEVGGQMLELVRLVPTTRFAQARSPQAELDQNMWLLVDAMVKQIRMTPEFLTAVPGRIRLTLRVSQEPA